MIIKKTVNGIFLFQCLLVKNQEMGPPFFNHFQNTFNKELFVGGGNMDLHPLEAYRVTRHYGMTPVKLESAMS